MIGLHLSTCSEAVPLLSVNNSVDLLEWIIHGEEQIKRPLDCVAGVVGLCDRADPVDMRTQLALRIEGKDSHPSQSS